MKHALSFDIEDWFHIIDIPQLEDRTKWEGFPTIVEEKTDLILAILDEYDVRATFFILGWIADKYPSIAKKIAARGHEIGTHSYWHRRVYQLSPEIFYKDLKKSIDVLQDQTGVKIKGFRAPSFSIIPGTEWAIEVMYELGLNYDASFFPAQRDNGGYVIGQGPQLLDQTKFKYAFPELPMSTMHTMIKALPFSGGGYLRLLPKWLIKKGFQQLEKKSLPGVVYLHPRDFAPDSPRVRMPLHRKFKSYVGMHTTEEKLRMLLKKFDFGTCEEVLKTKLGENIF